jgi:hypothetical protein
MFGVAIAEVSLGLWLTLFAGFAIARITYFANSSTLYWLVVPMVVFGILMLFSGYFTFRRKFIHSIVFLGILNLLCLIRWIANIRYVFPFGTASPSEGASVTMQMWQTQQFLLAFLALFFLMVTVKSTMQSN